MQISKFYNFVPNMIFLSPQTLSHGQGLLINKLHL